MRCGARSIGARELYRQARDLLTELGPSIMASSTAIEGAWVELLAGNLELAEEQLRRDYAELMSLDETYYRATIAGWLARILFLRGDLEGATEHQPDRPRSGRRG